MTIRISTLAAALGLALSFSGMAGAQEPAATSRAVRGVVELFTSQGCSSCPPADRLLADLAKDPGIVALAYHVDYWDYIGWTDPHGSRANTDRQRGYAKAFRTGTIYTPQAVINGQRDVIGSRAAQIDGAIKETDLSASSDKAWIGLVIRGDRLHVTADGKPGGNGRTPPVLVLVTFDDETRTEVERGENRGLTLVNTHAVRDWRILGIWDGKPLEIDIPLASLKRDSGARSGCAALLQTVTDKGAPGPILAAAAIEF